MAERDSKIRTGETQTGNSSEPGCAVVVSLFRRGRSPACWQAFIAMRPRRPGCESIKTAGARNFMEAVSWLGDWPGHVLLGLILTGIAYCRGNKRWVRIFAAMILACALAGIANRVVKISAGRARPNVQAEARWSGPNFSSQLSIVPVRTHRGVDRIFRHPRLRFLAVWTRIAGHSAAHRVFTNVCRRASSLGCRRRGMARRAHRLLRRAAHVPARHEAGIGILNWPVHLADRAAR